MKSYFPFVLSPPPRTGNVISSPTYLGRFLPTETRRNPNDEALTYELQHEEHPSRASYRPNVLVGMAWGLDVRPGNSRRTFDEEWATKFPDPEASWHYVDFFYGGTLVERTSYVYVDSHCDLPLPEKEIEGEGIDATVSALTITPWQRDFFRLLNALDSGVDYDSYLTRAGFQIVP